MKLKELCTLEVACCNKSTTIAEAARLMRKHHVGDSKWFRQHRRAVR